MNTALKLANSLKVLKPLKAKQSGVVAAGDIKDKHRLRLIDAGYLRPVVKGWYVCIDPTDNDDGAAWYKYFWVFVAGYLNKRFGRNYCLGAESSLLLHAGNVEIPAQVTVMTTFGGTSVIELPANTFLKIYIEPKIATRARVEIDGIQVYAIAQTLCRLGPQAFERHAIEVGIALRQIHDARALLSVLLADTGMPVAAARLALALAAAGRTDDARQIVTTMKDANFTMRTPQWLSST